MDWLIAISKGSMDWLTATSKGSMDWLTEISEGSMDGLTAIAVWTDLQRSAMAVWPHRSFSCCFWGSFWKQPTPGNAEKTRHTSTCTATQRHSKIKSRFFYAQWCWKEKWLVESKCQNANTKYKWSKLLEHEMLAGLRSATNPLITWH